MSELNLVRHSGKDATPPFPEALVSGCTPTLSGGVFAPGTNKSGTAEVVRSTVHGGGANFELQTRLFGGQTPTVVWISGEAPRNVRIWGDSGSG